MNLTIIIISCIAALWFLGAFFGFITGVPKAFKNDPSKSIDSSLIKAQSQEHIQSTENDRQKMMDDMKQKISDGYRKY